MNNDPSYDNALGDYEDSGANALALVREAQATPCPRCSFVAADAVELRVHLAFDHLSP